MVAGTTSVGYAHNCTATHMAVAAVQESCGHRTRLVQLDESYWEIVVEAELTDSEQAELSGMVIGVFYAIRRLNDD